MQGLDVTRASGKKLGRPAAGVPKEFVREYGKFQSGEYGSISVVQFAKLQGIAVSTFYKYAGLLKRKCNSYESRTTSSCCDSHYNKEDIQKGKIMMHNICIEEHINEKL